MVLIFTLYLFEFKAFNFQTVHQASTSTTKTQLKNGLRFFLSRPFTENTGKPHIVPYQEVCGIIHK